MRSHASPAVRWRSRIVFQGRPARASTPPRERPLPEWRVASRKTRERTVPVLAPIGLIVLAGKTTNCVWRAMAALGTTVNWPVVGDRRPPCRCPPPGIRHCTARVWPSRDGAGALQSRQCVPPNRFRVGPASQEIRLPRVQLRAIQAHHGDESHFRSILMEPGASRFLMMRPGTAHLHERRTCGPIG